MFIISEHKSSSCVVDEYINKKHTHVWTMGMKYENN